MHNSATNTNCKNLPAKSNFSGSFMHIFAPLSLAILGRARSASRGVSKPRRSGKGKKKTNTVNASRSSDDSTLRTHLRLEDKSWSWNLRRVLLSRRTWKIFASDSQPCVPRESVCAPRWLCALAEAAPSRWEKCVWMNPSVKASWMQQRMLGRSLALRCFP